MAMKLVSTGVFKKKYLGANEYTNKKKQKRVGFYDPEFTPSVEVDAQSLHLVNLINKANFVETVKTTDHVDALDQYKQAYPDNDKIEILYRNWKNEEEKSTL